MTSSDQPDEQLDIPREVFDRDIKWPKARKEPKEEPVHPDTTPDLIDGPFKDWIKEKVTDEEIGYEGER
jgi:hypothetical protein